jgi:hypothetical protein
MKVERVPYWRISCREGDVHVFWSKTRRDASDGSTEDIGQFTLTFYVGGKTVGARSLYAATDRKLQNLSGSNAQAVEAVIRQAGWHPLSR